MGFIGFALLGGAVLLLFSAVRGSNPLDVLRAFLRGEPMPSPTFTIDHVALSDSAPGAQFVSTAIGGGGRLQRPLSSWRVSSPYGMRNGRMHQGVDVMAPTGTPIRAAAAGRVSAVGWAGGAGLRVNITHGSGLETRYFHMSRTGTTVGATVGAGQVIGYVGSTGNSSGPHLHFEVLVNGAHHNPERYV